MAGPGAHSRVGCAGERVARVNHPLPNTWMAQVDKLGHGVAKTDKLNMTTVLAELIATGLHLYVIRNQMPMIGSCDLLIK